MVCNSIKDFDFFFVTPTHHLTPGPSPVQHLTPNPSPEGEGNVKYNYVLVLEIYL